MLTKSPKPSKLPVSAQQWQKRSPVGSVPGPGRVHSMETRQSKALGVNLYVKVCDSVLLKGMARKCIYVYDKVSAIVMISVSRC